MALKDQPYLPLYIQDVLTDEKLIECSASAHGVYFRLICILHKQPDYGLICLKQKYKQTPSKFINFAMLLCKQMPFDSKTIELALEELSAENVIQLEDDFLAQKRMVKDGKLSLTRAAIGKTGGSNVTKQYGKSGYLYLMSDFESKNKIGISVNPQNRLYRLRSTFGLKKFEIITLYEVSDMGAAEDLAQDFFGNSMDGEWVNLPFDQCKEKFALLKAKIKPNAEIENANTSESDNVNKNETKRAIFKKPELAEIAAYFAERNFSGLVQEEAEKFFNYYESNGWKVGKSSMKNWQAAIRNWISNYNKFNPTNKTNGKQQHTNRNDRESERVAGIEQLREATTAILNNGGGNTEQ